MNGATAIESAGVIAEFRDVLAELVATDARFLVVGAHALGVHGVPRATVDLDIWVDRAESNARKVYEALARFGAPLRDLGLDVPDLMEPDIVAQFGVAPYRIDILTSLSGLEFQEAWRERAEGTIEGIRVPVLGLKAFVTNKRASGRKKDLADLELLGLE